MCCLLTWISDPQERNECSFIFLFFYSLVVSDITYNTKDIQKNVNFYKYKVQIEEGPHRKIQREGRVCINNID
jgi:hypothetical protein